MRKEESITMKEKTLAIPFPGNLRDYFAGQAIGGLLTSAKAIIGDNFINFWAEMAYRIADAMLKERDKNEKT